MSICQGKPISISLSPNAEPDDIRLALKLFFRVVLRRVSRSSVIYLEDEFKNYLGIKSAFSFNSGRSALIAILEAFDIKEGDEVLLQAFTCNAAVNPILKLKAKPIFVDIDDTLNLDPKDLENKIIHSINSGRAPKAVMIQHTFGIPAKIGEIKEICKKHNLFLIEDCAHSLGAEYPIKKNSYPAPSKEEAGSATFQPHYSSGKVGTFGDAAFFSFGRDKIISSVYGGMAVSGNDKIGERLKKIQKNLPFPSSSWTLRQILHPIIFSLALPVFSFLNIGKAILYLCQKLKILSSSVYPEEKKGKVAKYFPKKMPNAIAILALNQFKKLDKFNSHRQEIAGIYRRELDFLSLREVERCLPAGRQEAISSNEKQAGNFSFTDKNAKSVFMRYSIFTERAGEIREKLKKQNILLDDGWHTLPIVPKGTDLEKMRYKKGSCPRAEKTAKTILNLPTGIKITKQDAERIIKLVKEYLNNENKEINKN